MSRSTSFIIVFAVLAILALASCKEKPCTPLPPDTYSPYSCLEGYDKKNLQSPTPFEPTAKVEKYDITKDPRWIHEDSL